jgi:hypothetical protein
LSYTVNGSWHRIVVLRIKKLVDIASEYISEREGSFYTYTPLFTRGGSGGGGGVNRICLGDNSSSQRNL